MAAYKICNDSLSFSSGQDPSLVLVLLPKPRSCSKFVELAETQWRATVPCHHLISEREPKERWCRCGDKSAPYASDLTQIML